MKLLQYLRPRGKPEGIDEILAEKAGTTPEYLWHIAKGNRKASPALAKRIEIATDGQVTRYDLRPDVFDPPTH